MIDVQKKEQRFESDRNYGEGRDLLEETISEEGMNIDEDEIHGIRQDLDGRSKHRHS